MLMLAVKTVVAVASGKIIRTKLRSSQIRKLSAAIVCAALALSFSPVLQASIFSQGEGSDRRRAVPRLAASWQRNGPINPGSILSRHKLWVRLQTSRTPPPFGPFAKNELERFFLII